MIYKNPRNLFQEKINNVVNRERSNIGILEHIFKLQQIFTLDRVKSNTPPPNQKDSWTLLLEVYTVLGKEKFAELINVVGGNTVSFPTSEEYQDSIITSLCYYYKEIEGLSWDKIKDKLDMPKLHNVKYGIKVRNFKGFIDNGTMSAIKRTPNE